MSTSSRFTTPAARALVAVTVLVALAGCATGTSHATASVPDAELAAASAPTPTPTPTPVTPAAVGAVLDAATAANLAPGWVAYPLADGTKVAVSATQPLPDPVRAQAIAPITAVIDALPHRSTQNKAEADAVYNSHAAVDRAAGAISQATGKRVAIIFDLYGAPDEGGKPGRFQMIWLTNLRLAIPNHAVYTSAEAVKDVNAWIATQSNPANYEVFVVK